jgi:hypothetical protein
LRGQALGWLRATVAWASRQLASDKPQERVAVQNWLRHCRHDPDLAVVRDPSALAKLPEAERQAWQQVWQEMERMLVKAERGQKKP